MNIRQLIALTPNSVRRAAARLQVVGFQKTADSSLTRFAAGMVGATRKLRRPYIESEPTGTVQVRCTCEYFEKHLALNLAAHKAATHDVSVDRRGRLLKSSRLTPSLCAHLMRLALISLSKSETTRQLRLAQQNSNTKQTPNKVDARLRGL